MSCCLSRRALLRGGLATSTLALSGCDGPPEIVSDETVEAMGLESWRAIRARTPVSRNRDYQEALSEVASSLVAAGGADAETWEFVVFESPEANAFALPGGRVGVFEGMFDVFETLDDLAVIVGHEIGHLEAEHGQKRVNAQVAKQYSIRALAWLLNAGEVEYADEIAAALGLGVEVGFLLPYSRDHELEADRLGLILMNEAGYDAGRAVPLWRRMDERSRGRSPEFLATHPAPESRIEAIEALLPSLG